MKCDFINSIQLMIFMSFKDFLIVQFRQTVGAVSFACGKYISNRFPFSSSTSLTENSEFIYARVVSHVSCMCVKHCISLIPLFPLLDTKFSFPYFSQLEGEDLTRVWEHSSTSRGIYLSRDESKVAFFIHRWIYAKQRELAINHNFERLSIDCLLNKVRLINLTQTLSKIRTQWWNISIIIFPTHKHTLEWVSEWREKWKFTSVSKESRGSNDEQFSQCIINFSPTHILLACLVIDHDSCWIKFNTRLFNLAFVPNRWWSELKMTGCEKTQKMKIYGGYFTEFSLPAE